MLASIVFWLFLAGVRIEQNKDTLYSVTSERNSLGNIIHNKIIFIKWKIEGVKTVLEIQGNKVKKMSDRKCSKDQLGNTVKIRVLEFDRGNSDYKNIHKIILVVDEEKDLYEIIIYYTV